MKTWRIVRHPEQGGYYTAHHNPDTRIKCKALPPVLFGPVAILDAGASNQTLYRIYEVGVRQLITVTGVFVYDVALNNAQHIEALQWVEEINGNGNAV